MAFGDEQDSPAPSRTNRIRVLHVITGLGVGGAENFLLRLAIATAPWVESRVIALKAGGGMLVRYRDEGIQVQEMQVNRLLGLLRLPYTGGKAVRSGIIWRPHVVQGWLNHGNVAALLLKRSAFKTSKLVWGVRQSFDSIELEKANTRMMIRLQIGLSRLPDAIVCNSRLGLEQLLGQGLDGRTASVVPNGFDTDRFAPDPARRAYARALFGARERDRVIGMVARFHPMKNYPGFLQAAAIVAKSVPRLRVVCIGTGVAAADSPLRALAAQLGLGNQCALLDERADLERVYPGLDVMCLSSTWGEGFPNVLAEAMACGVPCVTSDVGDAGQVVGDTGYVVPPGGIREMADAIVACLRLDEEGRDGLGLRARSRIVDRYSIPAVASRYLDLYGGLATGSPA
jgi:glycosyltransferase involved in cell wall biosynthesis